MSLSKDISAPGIQRIWRRNKDTGEQITVDEATLETDR